MSQQVCNVSIDAVQGSLMTHIMPPHNIRFIISPQLGFQYLRLAALCIFVCGLGAKGVCQMGLVPPVDVSESVKQLETDGKFAEAAAAIRAELKTLEAGSPAAIRLQFELDRLDRVKLDHKLTEDDVLNQIRADIPDVTVADLERWVKEGVLEQRVIEGEQRYFNRAVANLFRMSAEARSRRKEVPASPGRDTTKELHDHMELVAKAGAVSETGYVLPQRYNVNMTITVPADTVPSTATLRCWMTLPRECALNRDIEILESAPGILKIAAPDASQRSIYFEQKPKPGQPTVFYVEYQYTGSAFWKKIDPASIKPYDTNSELYKTYTAERPPHLVASPAMKQLAAEIVGDEKNPYLKAQKIFTWMDKNIRYTSALEYSTIMNISEYCAENARGDCGIQALLFINLCRIAGVPARWESGWYGQPGRNNMHDWAQFYVEPHGWLWADPSRGFLPASAPEHLRMFYFGNVDGFRLCANGDYSAVFDPPKKHFRSETVDFQRGEVEWEGGNLYFNQWQYKMDITPVD